MEQRENLSTFSTLCLGGRAMFRCDSTASSNVSRLHSIAKELQMVSSSFTCNYQNLVLIHHLSVAALTLESVSQKQANDVIDYKKIYRMNSIGWAILFKTGCFCTREQLTINGAKYTVIDNIAAGGFSMIDLVENNTTRTKFALKRITCHSVEDQEIALREIELMGRINSDNVVRLIDHAVTGTADIVVNATSEVYIVLPYYKNGSLQDHLNIRARNKDYMPEGQVLQLFLGICEGLRAFHEAQPDPLAHRDLKTANICLSNGMEPIIVDLGSAATARVQIRGQQEAQKLKDLAEERCSIVYRAPELFSVESYCMIDERTDIWSLGCILYAMCSPAAKCPFDPIYEKGDSVALAVLSGNITFPEDCPYSQDMQNLILFMLRINPMERPFIYSVIERTNDLIGKLESRI